jgi:general secretion pathway protein D
MKKLVVVTMAVVVSILMLANHGAVAQDRRSGGTSEARQAASRVLAVADERTNSLVVSAPEELMSLIEALVSEIDDVTEDITEVRVFPLRFADAEEMAEIITDVFEEDSQSGQSQSGSRSGGRSFFMRGGRGGSSQQQQTSQRKAEESKVVAVADTRTNSVVVTAASETMTQIAQMVKELDSDPAKDQKVFIYSLENADAETVAQILENMFEERGTSRGGTSGTGRSTSSTRQSVFGQGGQTSSSAGSSQSRFGGR